MILQWSYVSRVQQLCCAGGLHTAEPKEVTLCRIYWKCRI